MDDAVKRYRIRRKKRMQRNDAKFEESKHPRDENGRFASGSGGDNLKKQQLDIILKANPAKDDYHTWIREEKDIKSFDEVAEEMADIAPDLTEKMVEEAKRTGKITVYSSHNIKTGTFVTPSKMIAKDYAGSGSVKEMRIPIDHVAWIDGEQGQYVGPISKRGNSNG